MIEEIEIKLSIENKYIADFKQLTFIQKEKATMESNHYVSIYYDNVEQHLRRAGFGLRIRRFSNYYLQTIKSCTPAQEGLHKRQEWETVVNGFTPDFSVFPDLVLRKQLQEGNLNQHIIQLFKSDFHRITWSLTPEKNTIIECALDDGFVASKKNKEAFQEIELELRQGEEKYLFMYADMIQQQIPNVKPLNISKAERGYRLFIDKPA